MVADLINLMTDQTHANTPWPTYTHLRDQAPILSVPLTEFGGADSGTLTVLSRFDDVRAALAAPGFRHPVASDSDLQAHASYRRALEQMFAPRSVRSFGERIRSVSRQLLGQTARADYANFHEGFTEPFASRALLSLTGLTDAEVDTLMERKAALSGIEIVTGSEDPVVDLFELWKQDAYGYFDALFDRREKEPADDLATRLLGISFCGRRLTRDEMISQLCIFVRGSHSVTAALDCIVTRLATMPDAQRLARAEPAQRPRLIEELLRIDSPVMIAMRRAAHDMVIHDVALGRGDLVMLMLGAANTDERRYDDPLSIDLTRNTGHLSFSGGPHRCLGTHLARLELVVALEEILGTLDTFMIPAGEHVDFTFGVRWAESLPLECARASHAPRLAGR